MKAVFKSGKETGGKNPFERSSAAMSMGTVIALEWNCGTHMRLVAAREPLLSRWR